jgi:hypothetical protein
LTGSATLVERGNKAEHRRRIAVEPITLYPGGPPLWLIAFVIGGIGLTVGFLWIRRISTPDEDSDRSFFRYHRRR